MNEKETILGLISGLKNEVQENLDNAYMKHGQITSQHCSDIDYSERYEVQAQCHILQAKIDTINKVVNTIEEALPLKSMGAMP